MPGAPCQGTCYKALRKAINFQCQCPPKPHLHVEPRGNCPLENGKVAQKRGPQSGCRDAFLGLPFLGGKNRPIYRGPEFSDRNYLGPEPTPARRACEFIFSGQASALLPQADGFAARGATKSSQNGLKMVDVVPWLSFFVYCC